MGLFDRKYCDICKEKIGLLGNRKCADGNLCKSCAGKLSPFFFNRKKSTVAEIAEQLKYREANLERVKAFHTDRSIGSYKRVLVDHTMNAFMMTASSDLVKANPDVIDIAAVTDASMEVRETKREQKYADKDGKQKSYDPPRYDYYYTFSETIRVNHPYFSVIRFDLNSSPVKYTPPVAQVSSFLSKLNIRPDPTMSEEYKRYAEMGRDIRSLLLPDAGEAPEPEIKEQEEAPAGKVTCPYCGSVVTPDEEGCCPECTAPLNE